MLVLMALFMAYKTWAGLLSPPLQLMPVLSLLLPPSGDGEGGRHCGFGRAPRGVRSLRHQVVPRTPHRRRLAF